MERFILLPLKCPISFSLNFLETGCLYLLTGYNDEQLFHACASFGLSSGFKLNGNSGFNSYLTLSASFECCLILKILSFWLSCSPWNLEWIRLLYLFHLIHSFLLAYRSVLSVYGLSVSWHQSILLCFPPMFL